MRCFFCTTDSAGGTLFQELTPFRYPGLFGYLGVRISSVIVVVEGQSVLEVLLERDEVGVHSGSRHEGVAREFCDL